MVPEEELRNIQDAPFQYFHLSAMPLSEKQALKKKLKTELADVKCAIENFGTECMKSSLRKNTYFVEDHMAISGKRFSSENPQASMTKKRKFPGTNKQEKIAGKLSDREVLVIEESEAAWATGGTSKAEPQNVRGQKMDANRTRHCASLLNKLMTHKNGWLFNQPVDPVKLNIPDYFSIISRPMDLGTIKHKLESKMYSSTHQFAADVRLTFSNAMRYNPPGNAVHNIAKWLHGSFNSRWTLLEINWRRESSTTMQQSVPKSQKQVVTSKQLVQKTSMHHTSSLPRKTLTSAEKLKLGNVLAKLSIADMPPRLLDFLRKTSLLGENEEVLDLDIDLLDDDTLWNLQRTVRTSLDATCTKSVSAGKKCAVVSVPDLRKGGKGTIPKHGLANDKILTSPSLCKNDKSGGTNCCSNLCNGSTQSSSSDVDSERSSAGGGYAHRSVASNQELKKFTAGLQRHSLKYDLDGEQGPASVIDGDNVGPTSNPSFPTAITSEEEYLLSCEQQLSPTKALRAAKLKFRFADTILKAQHNMLLDHGEKGDPVKMQREREILERKQLEEEARVKAQVKAAAAAQLEAEAARKMQREKEREAARLALQKMEKTVDIDENSWVLKDLEDLAFSQSAHDADMPDEMVLNFVDGVEMLSGHVNPLEQLGLFMKNEDLDDEEVGDWLSPSANGDVEEGEIS